MLFIVSDAWSTACILHVTYNYKSVTRFSPSQRLWTLDILSADLQHTERQNLKTAVSPWLNIWCWNLTYFCSCGSRHRGRWSLPAGAGREGCRGFLQRCLQSQVHSAPHLLSPGRTVSSDFTATLDYWTQNLRLCSDSRPIILVS